MTIFGQHEEGTLLQFEHMRSQAKHAALMADGHVGYVMPIGGVAAYANRVSVVGVGFDIACGNAAIRTNLTLASFGDEPRAIHNTLTAFADEIASTVSFGVGRKNTADDAPVGSRGLGHTIASGFLALGQGEPWGARVPEKEMLFDLADPIGHDYWHLMNLAGDYAYAGREWVARKVVSLLGGEELELVHNHHNFAWKEVHQGDEVIVIRKGATPAFPGQKGFVGGSMGDDAVIVQGLPTNKASEQVTALQESALFSTVHGAGRVMSRTRAAGKRHRRSGRQLSRGEVSPNMMKEWVKKKGVILRGGGVDESPHVYRRLPDVLQAQRGTVEVLHVLRPLIAVMAGDNELDPYKD